MDGYDYQGAMPPFYSSSHDYEMSWNMNQNYGGMQQQVHIFLKLCQLKPRIFLWRLISSIHITISMVLLLWWESLCAELLYTQPHQSRSSTTYSRILCQHDSSDLSRRHITKSTTLVVYLMWRTSWGGKLFHLWSQLLIWWTNSRPSSTSIPRVVLSKWRSWGW